MYTGSETCITNLGKTDLLRHLFLSRTYWPIERIWLPAIRLKTIKNYHSICFKILCNVPHKFAKETSILDGTGNIPKTATSKYRISFPMARMCFHTLFS